MKFELSSIEQKKANEWMEQLRKEGISEYAGATGGAWSYEFTPTSLGYTVVVKHMSGKSCNVTDFSCW